MSDWNQGDLQRMAEADDLHIAPLREDGATHGTPTWIWSVVVNGALYARAYNGTASSWYKAAVRQRTGRITVSGFTKDVRFLRADAALEDAIDKAYREKYGASLYLNSMIGRKAKDATVLIVPQ